MISYENKINLRCDSYSYADAIGYCDISHGFIIIRATAVGYVRGMY